MSTSLILVGAVMLLVVLPGALARSNIDSTYLMVRVRGVSPISWPILFDYEAESLATWVLIDGAETDSAFTIYLAPNTRLRVFPGPREDVFRRAVREIDGEHQDSVITRRANMDSVFGIYPTPNSLRRSAWKPRE